MSYPALFSEGELLSANRLNQWSELWTNAMATRERCAVFKAAAQSIPNGVTTPLTFDTEVFDVGGLYDFSTHPTRITIPTGSDGFYQIKGRAKFASGAGTVRYMVLTLNGATFLAEGQVSPVGIVQIVEGYPLAAGDYLELGVYQDSGGALNTVAGDYAYTSFSVQKLF